MFNVDKTTISLTRGDSAVVEFFIPDITGKPAEITQEDTVTCQVRSTPNSTGELVFAGRVTYSAEKNSIIWRIIPSDTSNLDPGTYYWDAEIDYANGDIYTFVGISKFIVLPEVTLKE